MNFIAPIFLYGLSAIAVPVILHLIELRRAKRVIFTNVSFIKEVKNITSSHRRLKQLLILLARIGFIAFLVLLFAQPFIPAKNVVNEARAIKIYVDNSLSLQNESEQSGKNLLDQAIEHSQGVVAGLRPSTKINVQNNFRSAASNYTDFTPLKAKNFLADFKFSAYNKNFPALLSGFSLGSPVAYDALIYSDFQKRSFRKDYVEEMAQSPNNFYLVHLNGNAEYNAFVDSVYLEDEFIRLNANNKIKVTLRNTGSGNIENCNLKFFIDNQQVSAVSVSIPAKQTKSLDLVYRLSDTNLKQCRIVLQDYPVDFDNTYFFTLQASAQIAIVDIVESNSNPTTRLFTNEPLFKYQAVTPQQFNYTLLKNTNLIILNSLNQLSTAFAENLKEYIEAGGTVAVIPSGKGNGTSYINFFQRLGFANINFVRAGNLPITASELAPVDENNPFFRNIFENASTKVKMPNATPILAWNRSSSDILRFRSGNKFLSSFQKGRGQIYVFASPLAEEYTDFANHALFVPVMYKIGMESFKQKQQIAYTLGSTSIQYPAGEINTKEVIKLVKDSASFIPEQQIKNGVVSLSIPDELNEAGFFKLQSGNQDLTTIALNYNKNESDLETFSLNELKSLSSDAKNITVIAAADELALKKLFAQDNLGTQLWKYCLILCLIFALTEILLIRFM